MQSYPPLQAWTIMVEQALWSIADIVTATGGRLSGPVAGDVKGVSIDSRSVSPGDLFVAIKGDKLDGHLFVESALKAGAVVALVSHSTPAMNSAGAVIAIDADPLRGLEKLALAARKRSKAAIVAVTGSVGKTSTKEMMRLALAASGKTHASASSFNNHWGVPLSLARLHRDVEFGIFEIGMNHAGEIAPLVQTVRPHVAVITNIAASHLGHFTSLEDIAEAKSEIFSGLDKTGLAILNRDSPQFDLMRKNALEHGVINIITFGKNPEANVRLKAMALRADHSCISVDVCGTALDFRLGLPGEHMVLNSLSVLAAVHAVGADLAQAALALVDIQPAKGRGVMQRLQIDDGELLLLDESYNANPASVQAAMALLHQQKIGRAGRRIAVLGDMLELGDFGPRLHAELAEGLQTHHVDLLYAAGPLMAHLWNETPVAHRGAYTTTSAELTEHILKDVRAGDVVMIKGSLGSHMGPLADSLRAKYEPVKRTIT
jgi:UDP-N-acetylmuramoyl-tripeptide--D-alanyl-D-alanine ligase